MSRKISILFDADDEASDTIERLEDALDSVGDEAVKSGGKFTAGAVGAEALEESMEDAEDAAEELNEEMAGVQLSAGGISRALPSGDEIFGDEPTEGIQDLQAGLAQLENQGDGVVGVFGDVEDGAIDIEQVSEGVRNLDADNAADVANELDRVGEEIDEIDVTNAIDADDDPYVSDTQIVNLHKLSDAIGEVDDASEELSVSEQAEKLQGILPQRQGKGEIPGMRQDLEDISSGKFTPGPFTTSDPEKRLDQIREKIQEIENTKEELQDSVVTKDFKQAFKSVDLTEDVVPDTVSSTESIDEDVKQQVTPRDVSRGVDDPMGGVGDVKKRTQAFRKLSEENEFLQDITRKTAEEMTQETEKFMEAADGAQSLSEKKQLASDANQMLREHADLSSESLREEARATALAADGAMDLEEAKKKVSNRSQELVEHGIMSEEQMVKEAESFEEAALAANSLEGMKQAVSGANEKLARRSGETQQAILGEKDAILNAQAAAGDTEGALDRLADGNNRLSSIAAETRDRLGGMNSQQSSNALTALMYATTNMTLQSSLDEVGDEADDAADETAELARNMAAGTAAASLFSGELGNLSLNLGAVNIALKSITRQVPMLITTLGSLISVVGGLASAAVGAAGAMGGLFGAGVVAQAQKFEESAENVTSLSEGLQAVMANVKDQFMAAAEPILQQSETMQLFADTMNAVAQEIRFVSEVLANNITFFDDFSRSIGAVAQEGFREFVKQSVTAMVVLEDQLMSLIEFFALGLPSAMEFFTRITAFVGDEIGALISRFIDFAKELIEFGAAIQAGAIPVLNEFILMLTKVVDALNELGGETIANIAAFGALIGITNKFAGALAGANKLAIPFVGTLADMVTGIRNSNNAFRAFLVPFATFKAFLKDSILSMSGFAALANSLSLSFIELGVTAELSEEKLEELEEQSTRTALSFMFLSRAADESSDEMVEHAASTSVTSASLQLMRESLAGAAASLLDYGDDTEKAGRFTNLFGEGIIGLVKGLGILKTAILNPVKSLKTLKIALAVAAARLKLYTGNSIVATKVTTFLGGAIVRLVGTLKLLKVALLSTVKALGALAVSAIRTVTPTILLKAASLALSGAMGLLAGTTGAVVGGLLALAAIGALVVGVLGNAGSITEGLRSTMDAIVGTLKAVGGYLISKFVPIWNSLIPVFEVVLTLLSALNQALGFGGGDNGFLGSVVDALKKFVDFVFDILIGFFEFVAGLAEFALDVMGRFGMETADLSSAEISEGDVEDGVGQVSEGAEEMFSDALGAPAPKFDQTNVSKNFGDVNADPEEKEDMKRLVKEAMMEANTYRRKDDGFPG